MAGPMSKSKSEGSVPRVAWLQRTAIPESEVAASDDADADPEAPLLGRRNPREEEQRHMRQARRRCVPKWPLGSSNSAKERECYAPLTDMPSDDPSRGPHFRYEVNDMMRMVYEGNGVRKIARYREKKLVRSGWMSTKIWGTTYLASGYCWVQILMLWLGSGVVAVLVYGILHQVNDKTIASLQTGLRISDTLRTLAAFILGFYLEKTINIWWTLRHDTLQQLMNIVDNMCLRMAIYFPGNSYEDRHARETIMRYGILSLALLFKDAREVDVWSREEAEKAGALNLTDLMEERLLTTREAALLEGMPAKSQMCWVWISSLFTKWCLDGRLPDPLGNQNTMLAYSEQARNAISTILAQLNMQFPLNYSHLIVFFSKLYMIILSVEAGVTFGSSLHHTNYADVISKCFILTIAPILYQGLLEIKEHISNPFRDDITDYSFKMFHARLQNECSAFFKCAMDPPYTTAEDPEPAVLPPQFIERQVNTAMYDFDAR
ncbi:bestrophin [Chloropicon roscoffensis]|uniref:Bestrophin n=1 Tax=Chloropicon roscoffensis TaxID=1461544 RepID=A0A7S3CEU4_9CHLO